MLVVDASAAVALLLGGAEARQAIAGHDLAAPQLLDVEVTHALRRLVLRGEMDAGAARERLTLLLRAPISRVDLTGLVLDAWELRDRVTGYDAVHIALAARLACAVLTADERVSHAQTGVATVVVGAR